MKEEFLQYRTVGDTLEIRAVGVWRLGHISAIEKALRELPKRKRYLWDLTTIEAFDSAGVLLFIDYMERMRIHSVVIVERYTRKQEEMYKLLRMHANDTIPLRKERFTEELGKATVSIFKDIHDFVSFLGHLCLSIWYALRHPSAFRIKETVYHIHRSGFDALLITAMTAFLVGMVIAYQGGVQLAKFGADLFIVDTVGISVVRELGPMITAIVIAGRSGSAYTAEIGAMKITEEIAAMRTMGFDPYAFLVIPRIAALTIALPLLIFFADIIGIFGGMVASGMVTGISYEQFITRLNEVVGLKHYLLGMIKGPVFAFIIASVGCFRGFQVSDNTESIGLHTTASVVNGIFLVIAFDALFSVAYTELGL